MPEAIFMACEKEKEQKLGRKEVLPTLPKTGIYLSVSSSLGTLGRNYARGYSLQVEEHPLWPEVVFVVMSCPAQLLHAGRGHHQSSCTSVGYMAE